MTVEFRVAKLSGEEGKWSRPLGFTDALDKLRARIPVEAPVKWKERGDEFSNFRTRQFVFGRLVDIKPTMQPGDFFILAVKDDGRFGLRVVETFPSPIPTTGNDRVDLGRGYWVSLKVGGESWGICSCRSIAGSSSWSQHAYCNAEDIHASASGMATIWSGFIAQAARLNVAHAIYNRRIWDPSQGTHAYGGSNPHTDHVHVDYSPQGSGTPPCAR